MLDWEEVLPAMMELNNCHVHQATGESPFFLTHLHNPRLPVFNPLYIQQDMWDKRFTTWKGPSSLQGRT